MRLSLRTSSFRFYDSLKALVLAQQSQLVSREAEIADIEQLELRLEDLETSQAAIDPLPTQLAVIAANEKAAGKPARRPLP